MVQVLPVHAVRRHPVEDVAEWPQHRARLQARARHEDEPDIEDEPVYEVPKPSMPRYAEPDAEPARPVARFQRFDETGAYAASVVLALLAFVTLLAMNLIKPKESQG